MRRTGRKGEGGFERIGWDEALDIVAGRLGSIAAHSGPEAILPYSYGGSMGLLNGSGMDRRFFHRLGASRLDRTICATAGAAGLNEALGMRCGTDPEQFAHARLIIAWGANVLDTNMHLWPFIAEARRRGARFYTIDPRMTRTGKLADRHYYIHPGSDAALALGIMHVIAAEELEDKAYIEAHTTGFDELRERVKQFPPERVASLTGIAARDIVDLAVEYATTRPAAIRLNYGLQRSERGAMAVRTVALLPAITGAWRDVGGGALLSTSHIFQLNRPALERPDLQQAALGREARLVNMSQLGRALTELNDPPVEALVVYNSNPAAVAPHRNLVVEGLRREDLFTVVLEQFLTDTTDWADIVLPATTFLEHTDIYTAYGHHYLQLARPAAAPPGEAKPNTEVFRLIAARMGFDDPSLRETDDQMIRALLDSPHPFVAGITIEELERKGWVRLRLPEPFLPFAEGGFGTPSGKCEFRAATLGYEPPRESRLGDPELRALYPLELITAKAGAAMNSTFGYRADADAETGTAIIAPADAAPRGIATGDTVRIYNGRGGCRLKVSVEQAVMPGVVSVPAVRWPKKSPDGQNVNALTPDGLTDAGAGATFYSCLVEVERV